MHSLLATPSAGAKQKREQVFNMVRYNLSRMAIEKLQLPLSITVESEGLTSRATQGGTTIVTVQMLQTESTGIGQIGSPLVDGTVAVTQRPITLPDNTSTSTDRYVAESHGKLDMSEDHDYQLTCRRTMTEEMRPFLAVQSPITFLDNTSTDRYESYLPRKQVVSRPEGSVCDDARSLVVVEQTRSGFVGHPGDVLPLPPGPRGELHVSINTQEEQSRTNDDGTIINLGSPAMDPRPPPSVNNAPAAVSSGDEADAETKRVSEMVIPVCSLTVAAALALIMQILFQKPSDAGDVAAAGALYSVAMTFIALGLCVSVALVIYSILAKRTRRPRGTRVLKSAMAMSVIFVFVAFITCAVFMLALPWLFLVGAVATAMVLYLVLIWKKDDDGAEGGRTRSGVV